VYVPGFVALVVEVAAAVVAAEVVSAELAVGVLDAGVVPARTVVVALPAEPEVAPPKAIAGAVIGAAGVLKLSSRASAIPVMRSARLARFGIGGLLDRYCEALEGLGCSRHQAAVPRTV